jgi:biotin carboxyl carrier protein
MRLTIEVDGERFDVDVQRTPEGVTAECEDATLKARGRASGVSVELESEGQRWRLDFESDDHVSINGRAVAYHVAGFAPGAPMGAAGQQLKVPVRAAMHGRLVKVLVEAGQTVSKGTPLFVLEAMKMQNELASPTAGTVAQIIGKPGEVVDLGRVLAWLERTAPA